ncbi:hypothetical protein IHQ71_01350 [Rhizobium sp. TH2]|uniref:hypothetical protein n=1 Tax=Rhizobium sp. TH2 TaxID=2775403 RepID=UPI0021583A94|nr:hypothetical protein [Rhizobium sp. TH2]UVC09306.1 hypothetical protein IHQ71_01350 [Rhizobium sp. TH2]
MKHPVSARNFNHWAPAMLRQCLNAEFAHIRCPLRKCRRDGCCTGPLVAMDDTRALRLAPMDITRVRADETLMPFCFNTLPHDMQSRAALAYEANVKTLLADPQATVEEATRTIGARSWKKFVLGSVPVGAE